MSAADTAREGRVYDRHGLYHHPRGSRERDLCRVGVLRLCRLTPGR
nr:MAG TPA: hypothetical protein [Caudoviricetes sp.]